MTYLPDILTTISTINSTTIPLGANELFVGAFEEVINYSLITIALGECSPIHSGGDLIYEFSFDGITIDKQTILSIPSITTPQPGIYTITPIMKYFRVKFQNDNIPQNAFRLQTIFHRNLNKNITSRLAQTIDQYAGIESVQSILYGQDNTGIVRGIKATPKGYIKAAIGKPITAYNELKSSESTLFFNSRFPYPSSFSSYALKSFISGSSGHINSNGMENLFVDSVSGSYSSILSRRVIQNNPGFESSIKFSCIFGTPVSNSIQLMGIGQAEEGLFFGYNNFDFGILYRQNGTRPICAFNITTGSNINGTTNIILNGVTKSVSVTNNNNTIMTANEIAKIDYSLTGIGWESWTSGSTVYFVGLQPVPTLLNFNISGSNIGSVFQNYVSGAVPIDNWISQSNWNIDTMNDVGGLENPSHLLIQPTKINSYEINFTNQFADFMVHEPVHSISSSNYISEGYINVHRINLISSASYSLLRNPSLPFYSYIRSNNINSPITASIDSMSGMIYGKASKLSSKKSYSLTKTNIGSTTFTPVITFHNPRVKINVFDKSLSKISFMEILFNRIAIGNNGQRDLELALYYNPVLNNTANFTEIDNSNTAVIIDTSATSFTSTGRLLWTSVVLSNNSIYEILDNNKDPSEYLMVPGDYISLAAKGTAGINGSGIFSINWFEFNI